MNEMMNKKREDEKVIDKRKGKQMELTVDLSLMKNKNIGSPKNQGSEKILQQKSEVRNISDKKYSSKKKLVQAKPPIFSPKNGST